jgi:hypothetical protein
MPQAYRQRPPGPGWPTEDRGQREVIKLTQFVPIETALGLLNLKLNVAFPDQQGAPPFR